MIYIRINPKYNKLVEKSLIRQAAKEVGKYLHLKPPFTLTIVIEDNNEIQKLNRDFRSINSPTDVLSFPSEEIDPVTNRKYIGDIVISLPMVLEQAKKSGYSEKCEFQLMVVHGFLHLLQYDHDTPINKQVMWKIQSDILWELGCGDISPQ